MATFGLIGYVVGALVGIGVLVRWENRRWFARWVLHDLASMLPEFERHIRAMSERLRAFGVAAERAGRAADLFAAALGVAAAQAGERMEHAAAQLRLAIVAELERRERARAAATPDRS